MYTTLYNVIVYNHVTYYTVASGLRSRSEAEKVKSAWLGVFPDYDVKIYGRFVPLKGCDPLV